MKLYETINARNWRKGIFGDNEKGCIMGHARITYRATAHREALVYRLLIDAIKLLYPDRVSDDEEAVIGGFNDHYDTTVEDVIRVCKLADV